MAAQSSIPAGVDVASISPIAPGVSITAVTDRVHARRRFTRYQCDRWSTDRAGLSDTPDSDAGRTRLDRFRSVDVQAKAADGRRDMQYQDYVPMVQMLLEKRFGLTMHRETKTMPVMVLVLGKESHRLRASPEGDALGVEQGEHGALTFRHVSSCSRLGSKHAPRTSCTHRCGSSEAQGLLTTLFARPGPARSQVPWRDCGDRLMRAVQDQLGLKLERQRNRSRSPPSITPSGPAKTDARYSESPWRSASHSAHGQMRRKCSHE